MHLSEKNWYSGFFVGYPWLCLLNGWAFSPRRKYCVYFQYHLNFESSSNHETCALNVIFWPTLWYENLFNAVHVITSKKMSRGILVDKKNHIAILYMATEKHLGTEFVLAQSRSTNQTVRHKEKYHICPPNLLMRQKTSASFSLAVTNA